MFDSVELCMPRRNSCIAYEIGRNQTYMRLHFRIAVYVLRLKTIPVFTGAGFSVSVTSAAECKAVPLIEASLRIVRCFIFKLKSKYNNNLSLR